MNATVAVAPTEPAEAESKASIPGAVTISRWINLAAILAMLGVLSGSLYAQFALGEQPCPLCLIQRVGMFGVVMGPIMNLTMGIRVRHYGVSILSAAAAAATSVRQILLHIVPVPGQPTGFGSPILGFHMYTWAFIVFCIAIVGIAFLLLWQQPFETKDNGVFVDGGWIKIASIVVIAWVCFYLLLITLAVIPECGLGMCPDNPDNTKPWLGVFFQ